MGNVKFQIIGKLNIKKIDNENNQRERTLMSGPKKKLMTIVNYLDVMNNQNIIIRIKTKKLI